METMPIWMLFLATVFLVSAAIEAGFRLGRFARRRSEDEKESPVSAIAASILGLLAFLLAFTFSIASGRYDSRKELVREDANAIRTAFLRSDFLPEKHRGEAVDLLRRYVDLRLAVVGTRDVGRLVSVGSEIEQIQRRLWEMAVVNARQDMNSDVAALYIESLNDMINCHALRVAVGLQARIPTGIWLSLYVLVILGMLGVGYQTGIAGSRRSWSMPILAVAFSLVIALIASMDNPQSSIITVSQQPLADLRARMGEPGSQPGGGKAP
jgi:hypothetical protein